MPTLQIRSMDESTVLKIRVASVSRGITMAEYLKRLVELHEELRTLSYPADPYAVPGYLTKLGLESVKE